MSSLDVGLSLLPINAIVNCFVISLVLGGRSVVPSCSEIVSVDTGRVFDVEHVVADSENKQ